MSDADREAERADPGAADGGAAGGRPGRRGGLPREGESGRRWIVDPLDGTMNFLYGLRAWGVSIALEDEDGLRWAWCFNPVRGECSPPSAARAPP